MADTNIKSIKKQAESCCTNMFLYAKFVNEQSVLFIREQIKDSEQLKDIWQEMEILNACVLSEWEDDGNPNKYDEKWNEKYRKDAESLVTKLIEIL